MFEHVWAMYPTYMHSDKAIAISAFTTALWCRLILTTNLSFIQLYRLYTGWLKNINYPAVVVSTSQLWGDLPLTQISDKDTVSILGVQSVCCYETIAFLSLGPTVQRFWAGVAWHNQKWHNNVRAAKGKLWKPLLNLEWGTVHKFNGQGSWAWWARRIQDCKAFYALKRWTISRYFDYAHVLSGNSNQQS